MVHCSGIEQKHLEIVLMTIQYVFNVKKANK